MFAACRRFSSNIINVEGLRPLQRYSVLLDKPDGEKSIVKEFDTFLAKQRPMLEYVRRGDEACEVGSHLLRAYAATGARTRQLDTILTVTLSCNSSKEITQLFNTYLQCLADGADAVPMEAVRAVEGQMALLLVARDAISYQNLMSLYLSNGVNPRPLWDEMVSKQIAAPPSMYANVLQTMARAYPDGELVAEIVGRLAEQPGSTPERATMWLSVLATDASISPRYLAPVLSVIETLCNQSEKKLDVVLLPQTIRLLERQCWRFRDIDSFDAIQEILSRHGMARTNVPVEKARVLMSNNKIERGVVTLDGILDLSEASTESVAGEMTSPEAVDEAYYCLESRRKNNEVVQLSTFHVIILACSLMGDEQRAVETVAALPSFNLKPTVVTFMYMIHSCGYAHNKARNTEVVLETMSQHKVEPTEAILDVAVSQLLMYDNLTVALRVVRTHFERYRVLPSVYVLSDLARALLQVGDGREATSLILEAAKAGVHFDDRLVHFVKGRSGDPRWKDVDLAGMFKK